jgi:hypothetical protein
MAAGDLDGDGATDIVVADAYWGTVGGAAWVAYGPVNQDIDLDQESYRILGANDDDEFGLDIAFPGDLDGDGASDLAVSAVNHDCPYENEGAVYLFRDPVRTDLSARDADATLCGETTGQYLGSVWPVGDLDGDGYDDLVVSAPNAADGELATGAVYVLLGPSPAAGESTVASAHAKIVGQAPGDLAGASVALAGDINEDGIVDVFIGATQQPGYDEGKAGVSYLVLGPISGTTSLADAAETFRGTSPGELAGIVGGNIDLNGDGVLDLVVGAPWWPSYDLANGALYGLFGPLLP